MAARHLVLGAAVVGMGVGATASYFYLRQQKELLRTTSGDDSIAGLAQHPASKHGIPIGDRLRMFPQYVASYDTRLRNPRWVLEHLSKGTLTRREGNRKQSTFVEDAGIERRFRAKLADFRGSGFDRGHHSPASNQSSQQAMDDSFCLTNISPQVGPGFNRDYWARFERFVRDLTKGCSDVWVITGPLYLPQPAPQGMPGYVMNHRMIGVPPQLMAVPTHYFKVVLGELNGGKRGAVGAFVMPNAAIAPDVPLTSFAVPISALEEVAGLRFFPGYLSDARREAIDRTAAAVQSRGHAELLLLKPGHQLHLLAAPDGSVPAAQQAVSLGGGLSEVPPTDQRLSLGAVHLCEHTECRLPVERFWESGGSNRTSSVRALRRTAST